LGNGGPNKPDEVGRDTVYRETYTEMRRFRDYELSIANWYSSFLLAITGGLIALRSVRAPDGVARLIASDFWIQLAVGVGILLLGGVGSWSSRYSSARYAELRKNVSEQLEPEFSRRLRPSPLWLRPGSIISSIPLLIAFVALLVLLYPIDEKADGIVVVVAFLAGAGFLVGIYRSYPAESQ